MGAHGPQGERLDGTGVRLALVTSRFNDEVTEAMRRQAHAAAQALGAAIVLDVRVPGVYDLPLAVDRALLRTDVEAAVALGAIVTGQTGHDVLIGQAAAHALTGLSLKHGKPVGLGVTGPGQTLEQATARIDRAAAAVRSAVQQFRTLEGIRSHDA